MLDVLQFRRRMLRKQSATRQDNGRLFARSTASRRSKIRISHSARHRSSLVCLLASSIAFYIFSSRGKSGPRKYDGRWKTDVARVTNQALEHRERKPQRIRSDSSKTEERLNTGMFPQISRCNPPRFSQIRKKNKEKSSQSLTKSTGKSFTCPLSLHTTCIIYYQIFLNKASIQIKLANMMLTRLTQLFLRNLKNTGNKKHGKIPRQCT